MNKYALLPTFFMLVTSFLGAPFLVSAGFFGDTETATKQRFVASELVLVRADSLADLSLSADQPMASATFTPTVSSNSVPADFAIQTSQVTGSCRNIQLQWAGQPAQPAATFGSGEQTQFQPYQLDASLIDPNVTATGTDCTVTLEVTAWQENMSQATAGYRDEMEYQLQITLPQPVPTPGPTNFAPAAMGGLTQPQQPDMLPSPSEPEIPTEKPETKPESESPTEDPEKEAEDETSGQTDTTDKSAGDGQDSEQKSEQSDEESESEESGQEDTSDTAAGDSADGSEPDPTDKSADQAENPEGTTDDTQSEHTDANDPDKDSETQTEQSEGVAEDGESTDTQAGEPAKDSESEQSGAEEPAASTPPADPEPKSDPDPADAVTQTNE